MQDAYKDVIAQYRAVALAAEALAQKATDADSRAWFTALAETWRRFAFRTLRRRRTPAPKPRVKKKVIDPDQSIIAIVDGRARRVKRSAAPI